jgi:DNA (cytosine-5)-methyltransferase 1
MTFGSLFAGIGGFDLGFERAGMRCEWQVEIDPYCQRVLAKHWPNVRRRDDVRTFPPAGEWGVDVICGGFPCQDISDAGSKAGIGGSRSGLWKEMHRIICTLRPRFAVVENVAAVLDRGHGEVLGDMAASGFDGEWEVVSACQFGAPHARERMFYVFYANGSQLRASWSAEDQAAPAIVHLRRTRESGWMAGRWAVESEPCSVVYGFPGVVDRLRGFGNAVVPDTAEWIGRRIVAAEAEGQNHE